MAGYSSTPLWKKLGVRESDRALLINTPNNYKAILTAPFELSISSASKVDFIHIFVTNKEELVESFKSLKNRLEDRGTLWISWPKKTSKRSAELDENIIRNIGLKEGLVDVKVCAVDETWSGLKFVRRLKDRRDS